MSHRALTDTIRWILSVEPPTAPLAGGITTFKFTSLSVSALSTFGLLAITPLSLNYCFTIESYCFTIESLLLAPYGWLCMFLASFSDVVVCSAPVIRQGQLAGPGEPAPTRGGEATPRIGAGSLGPSIDLRRAGAGGQWPLITALTHDTTDTGAARRIRPHGRTDRQTELACASASHACNSMGCA